MNVQLLISLENGVLSLAGPVDDPILCYGLLEAAKDAVRDIASGAATAATKPPITIVPAGALPRT